MTRRLSCPEDVLAGEIEFAIAYVVACNPGRLLLLSAPDGDRAQFAAALAGMLTERAGNGLSGMRIEDAASAGVPGPQTESSL